MKRFIWMGLIVVLVLGMAGEASSRKKKPLMLRFGTSSVASGMFAYFVSFAASINKALPGEVRVTAIESGATKDNLVRIGKGEFDMGHSDSVGHYEALRGLGGYKENPSLRLLINYCGDAVPAPLALVVRADSGISTVQELEGKPFHPGGHGSGAEQNLMAMFKVLGIKPNYFIASMAEAERAILEKRIVGTNKGSLGVRKPDGMIMRIEIRVPMRPLFYSDDDIKKIKAAIPYYSFVELEPGVYKGQVGTGKIFANQLGIATTPKIPEDIAYKMVKAILADRETQIAALPISRPTDLVKATLESNHLILHAGTVRCFKEMGVDVPQQMIPPEYKK